MPNTFPSNSPASGSAAAVAASVPTILNGSNSTADRRDNLQVFFEDTAANRTRFGNRYSWAERALNVTDYTAVINLAGPGQVDFLTLFRENSTTANDYSFRVVIDGVVVLEIDPAWEASTDATEGYAVVGDFVWNNTTFVPEYGGLQFEQVRFLTSFTVEVKVDVTSINDKIAVMYRWQKL